MENRIAALNKPAMCGANPAPKPNVIQFALLPVALDQSGEMGRVAGLHRIAANAGKKVRRTHSRIFKPGNPLTAVAVSHQTRGIHRMGTGTHGQAGPTDLPLWNAAADAESEKRFREYRETFARDHAGPYAIQWPGKDWKTRHKSISDPLLLAHLAGKYWVATRGVWYPKYLALDFDNPKPGHVETQLERLGVTNNCVRFTSPSWNETRSEHVFLSLSYKNSIPTLKLGRQVLTTLLGDAAEVYPHPRRMFRLPCGRDQHLLGKHGEPLKSTNLEQCMYWLEKLEPVPIESFPWQPPLPLDAPSAAKTHRPAWGTNLEAQTLWDTGLTASRTRHNAVCKLAWWLFRLNHTPEQAVDKLIWWQERRSNGFSATVLKGDWEAITYETCKIVRKIWDDNEVLPDDPHNWTRAIGASDVRQAVELFRGEVVELKRFLNLVAYYRPRRKLEFVPIHQDIWRDGTHANNVEPFKQRLEGLGLMDSIPSYCHIPGRPDLSYSRKYRLKLAKQHDAPLQEEGRNVVGFYAVARHIWPIVRDAVDATGVPKQRFYDDLAREKRVKSNESN